MKHKIGTFILEEVDKKCDDKCEECEGAVKPLYHLQNGYDNIDAILCKGCLNKLKALLNTVES